MDASALVGTWDLVAWTIATTGTTTSTVHTPYGSSPSGQLMYSADGRMCALIHTPGRAPLSTASPRQAPLEEQAAAFASCFAYAGTYVVDGSDVLHTVTLALNPALVGTVQRRHATLAVHDGRMNLTLSASEQSGAGLRHHVLQWRRA